MFPYVIPLKTKKGQNVQRILKGKFMAGEEDKKNCYFWS
jgi:hypothetical protein